MSPRNTVIGIVLVASVFLQSSICSASIQESIFNLGPRLFNHSLRDVPEVPENLIASPIGLSLGFGLIESMISEDLKKLILEEFFHWKDGEEAFQRNLINMQRVLRSAYQNSNNDSSADVIVNIENAVFQVGRIGVNYKPIADAYQAQFVLLRKNVTSSALKEKVNTWARDVTHDLITDFPVPDHFKVFLANTIYFEGDWVEPFSHQLTRKGIFKPSPNVNHHLQNVSYLQGQLEDLPYYEDDQMKVIRMSYRIKDLSHKDVSMFVLLPKDDHTLRNIIDRVTFTTFQDIVRNKMTNETVNVKIPKVKLQHRINIKEVLESCQEQKSRRWMRSTTGNNTSNHSYQIQKMQRAAFAPNQDSMLTEFIQETVLEVNEKGTRAAAITAGIINYDGLKKNFRCDCPYLMVIYDSRNDVVLFWAAVYKPT